MLYGGATTVRPLHDSGKLPLRRSRLSTQQLRSDAVMNVSSHARESRQDMALPRLP